MNLKKTSVVVLFTLLFTTLFGCKNKASQAANLTNINLEEKQFTDLEAKGFLTNFNLNFQEESVQDIKNSTNKDIQNLANYKTNYNIKRYDLASAMTALKTIAEPSEEKSKKNNTTQKEFKVISWGPQKEISSNSNHPEFYVTFSLPVKSLSALEEKIDGTKIFTVSPSVKGKYYWNGTKQLVFVAEEELSPSQSYTIKVNEKLKYINGIKISGPTSFTTFMEELKIKKLEPGSSMEQRFYYNPNSGVPESIANNVIVFTNIFMTQDEFKKRVEVIYKNSESKNCSFNVTPIEKDYEYNSAYHKVEKSNIFYVRIDEKIIKDSVILINPIGSLQNGSSYEVLKPFKFESNYFNEYRSTLRLNFNQPVDKNTVVNSISFLPELKFDISNITISGNQIIFRDLKYNYDTKYSVTISTALKDKYGQALSQNSTVQFNVPKASSYLKMLDTGNVILESQFPHKFIIEHQNLLSDSFYSINSVENPLVPFENKSDFNNENKKSLNPILDNLKHLEVIDLDPYLKNGLGFIRISSHGKINYWDSWENKYYERNSTGVVNIQVTNLGVTARVGFDKVVALVRTLSDNEPVKNATVSLYRTSENTNVPALESLLYATGVTDENGFIELSIPEKYQAEVADSLSLSQLAIFVQKENDKLTYYPTSHATWRFNVSTTSPKSVYQGNNKRIFIFTDRGLYKPGEVVSYRGIARVLNRDGYKSLSGKYIVKFEKKSWQKDEVYAENIAILSKSGGFYGTFNLPKDIKPGDYAISFYDEKMNCLYSEYFTVAFFEKSKFEVSAEIPDLTTFAGDSITANLYANYLAGGSLTGATYEASWYKQATDFVPPAMDAENYIFGPSDSKYYIRYISQSKGNINENGATKISCNTTTDNLGQPYLYRTEIGVTDISNQRIYAGASKLVHPALFYIGAAKNVGEGFPKVNEKITVPFALFNIDGTFADSSMVKDKIEYSVTRSYWTCINEDSVDGIYSNWQEVTEKITEGHIQASTKGSISFVPPKAGFYKLFITAKDKNLNTVKTDKTFYVTGAGYVWYESDNSTALRLSTDKKIYKIGDTAHLLLQSPLPKGDYLVTVERDSIISSKVIHLDSSCETIDVPIEKSYMPCVYVSVSSYSTREKQPSHKYGEVDLDKPKGYYGVTTLLVDRTDLTFDISVETDKKNYRPGDKMSIKLKATKNGVPVPNAELSVMAVDRAVIDLINYHVSDPLNYFYDEHNFPLAVKGGDSRAYLMNPVTYKINSLQGGDASEARNSELKDERKDFRPTALFKPVVITDSRGEAEVSFKLPDSLTTYRITAFGVKENSFALKESEFKVQNPINVQAIQARRLRVRDTTEVGVLISNLDQKSQSVTVNLVVRQPKENYGSDTEKGLNTIAGQAFVDGESSQTVTVAALESVPLYFNVGAKSCGMVELVYEIKSDVLNERLVSKIEIEKPFTFETVAVTGVVESSLQNQNKKESYKEQVVIPSWAEENTGAIEITLDPTQLGLMSSSVKYVFDYPFGCIEQQASKILPLIIFGNYIDTFGLESKINDPKKVVTSWFSKIKNEQHENGAFPYWPGNSFDNPFVSVKLLHLYKAAIDEGYTENEIGYDFDSLKKYIISERLQNNRVENSKSKTYSVYDAYVCYVLSLFQDSSLDEELEELYELCIDSKNDVSLGLISYTALAYQNKNEKKSKKRAAELADIIKSHAKFSARGISFDSFSSKNDYFCGMLDNDSEGYANALQLFVKENPNDEIVNKILYSLLQKQKSGFWQSTATTARVFDAIATMIKVRNLEALDFVGTAIIQNKQILQGTFKGLGAKPQIKSFDFSGSELKNLPRNKTLDLDLIKDGIGSLYYTVQMRYAIPEELCSARDAGFEVVLKITDENGNEVKPLSADSKVIVLEAGKVYNFNTCYFTNQDRNFAALRVPVPSGVEIVDSKLSTGKSKNNLNDDFSNDWNYYDDTQIDGIYSNSYNRSDEYYEYFYDNEAQYFHNYFEQGQMSHSLTVRATRKGVYPTPPVQAELMYEPEVFGRTEGYLFIVK